MNDIKKKFLYKGEEKFRREKRDEIARLNTLREKSKSSISKYCFGKEKYELARSFLNKFKFLNLITQKYIIYSISLNMHDMQNQWTTVVMST